MTKKQAARTARQGANREREDEELPEGDDEDKNERVAAAIAAELGSETEADWTCRIYRVLGPTKKGFAQPWVMNCRPDELPSIHEVLRDRYNGGDFRVRVLKDGQFYRAYDLAVEAPATPVAAIAPAGSEFERRMDRLEQTITRVLERPQRDDLDQLERLSGVLRNLQPATSAAATTDGASLLDAFTRGLSLSGKLGSNSGEASFISEAAQLLQVPAVASFVENASAALARASGRPAAIAGPPAAAIKVPAPPAAQPASSAQASPTDPIALAKQNLAYLLRKAKEGSSPILYAHWLEDNTPAGAIDVLLKDPNLSYTLQTLEPGFANYRPWLDDLLNALRQIREEEGDEEPPAHNGNDARPAANAS